MMILLLMAGFVGLYILHLRSKQREIERMRKARYIQRGIRQLEEYVNESFDYR